VNAPFESETINLGDLPHGTRDGQISAPQTPEESSTMMAEIDTISDEKKRLHRLFLDAVDHMQCFDYVGALAILEAILPCNLAVDERLRDVSKRTGMVFGDASFLTLQTYSSLLETKAHLGQFAGMDEQIREAEILADRVCTEEQRVHFNISLAKIKSGYKGFQEYIEQLDVGLRYFGEKGNDPSFYTYLLDQVDLFLWLSDIERAWKTLEIAQKIETPVITQPSRSLEQISADADALFSLPEYRFLISSPSWR
jgi:hypothetical protein